MKIKKHSRHARRPGLSRKAGLAPGTPVFIGEQKRETVRLDIIDYSAEHFVERIDVPLDECARLKDAPSVTWINMNGIHDIEQVQALGTRFGLHALTFEDIVNTVQRPKIEQFDDYLFIVLKMITADPATHDLRIEHVSLILGEGFVLSFLEDVGDVFDGVRERLRAGKGRMRKTAGDYLAYALMDAIVDQYFSVLEMIGDHTEALGDQVIENPQVEHMHEIHRIKRLLLTLRKSVWPLREEIAAVEKSDSELVSDSTRPFLRDLYDHTIHVIEMVETQRDILGGLHDTYLAGVTHRMNEVMKVLTIIATIFIPLTFIVGIYGMNFEHMPELSWRWGYFGVLGVMTGIGFGMLWAFRRRGWL